MTETPFSKLSQIFSSIYLGLMVMQGCVILSGTLFALLNSSEDCSSPVRAWLITNSSVSIFIIFLSVFWRFYSFIVWCIWNIIWSILGAVWILGDDSCESSFNYGYASGSIILTSSFFIVFLVLTTGCVVAVAACIGYGLMSNYENIE